MTAIQSVMWFYLVGAVIAAVCMSIAVWRMKRIPDLPVEYRRALRLIEGTEKGAIALAAALWPMMVFFAFQDRGDS
jgi:hypothetical protein